jgi:hypothetical protein
MTGSHKGFSSENSGSCVKPLLRKDLAQIADNFMQHWGKFLEN